MPDQISQPDPLLPLSSTEEMAPLELTQAKSPVQGQFASMMKGGPLEAEGGGKLSMISPFELASTRPALSQTPTVATVLAQVDQARSTLGDLSSYLSTPNLKLKAGQKSLLGAKLADANTHLQAVTAKLGGEEIQTPRNLNFTGPFGKFLHYLADGQAQLEAAKGQLQGLKNKGEQLSPGDFLLIQIKMNKAQQELDFSSVMLSNAVQGFKMLMQVQL